MQSHGNLFLKETLIIPGIHVTMPHRALVSLRAVTAAHACMHVKVGNLRRLAMKTHSD